MEQLCKRTENKLEFCPDMEKEIESGEIFENVSPVGRRYLIMLMLHDEIFINFCPFGGGKLAED